MNEDVLFEMYRGDDHAIRVTFTDNAGQPLPITGWSFKATMSLNPYADTDDDAPVKVDMPNLSGTDASNGVLVVVLPREQTQNLVPGKYYFDIQREVNGVVQTLPFENNRVKVKVDVTRRTG